MTVTTSSPNRTPAPRRGEYGSDREDEPYFCRDREEEGLTGAVEGGVDGGGRPRVEEDDGALRFLREEVAEAPF